MATSRQSLRANTEQLDPRAKGEVIGQRPEYVRQPLPDPEYLLTEEKQYPLGNAQNTLDSHHHLSDSEYSCWER
ncbi:hypothetical protein FRB95_001593 [Tulasnella sp. JGI-2019a]|nr:hypothetical protein FRB95_001593 [Tulasnella sp. JGI-2019a]